MRRGYVRFMLNNRQISKKLTMAFAFITLANDALMLLVFGSTARPLTTLTGAMHRRIKRDPGITQEEATSLHQVHVGVKQMDEITKRNTAILKQATGASHCLLQKADMLLASVSEFQIKKLRRAAARNPRPDLTCTGRAVPIRTNHKVEGVAIMTPVAANRSSQQFGETATALRSTGRCGAALKPEIIEDRWEEF